MPSRSTWSGARRAPSLLEGITTGKSSRDCQANQIGLVDLLTVVIQVEVSALETVGETA
jgi:hypothetical protein